MLRSLLRLSAAAAFAALLMPGVPSAAPPPGLAYDENRADRHQRDAAAARQLSGRRRGAHHQPDRRGHPDPGAAKARVRWNRFDRRRHRRGGNVAGAAGGAVASNAMDNAAQNSLGAQFGAMGAGFANFLQPHLMRYAFWNGWERVEDVTTRRRRRSANATWGR